MLTLILLGPPGAGKGTQAVKIKERFNVPHISTGDIFRKNIKERTPLGQRAQKYMDKGELVPDSLVIEIALARLVEDDCQDGFLLDGFPRTVGQALALDTFLEKHGRKITKALDITVEKSELLARLSGRRVCRSCGATFHVTGMPPKREGMCDLCGGELEQRADDAEETVLSRIEVYESQTKPLVEYYRQAGNLAVIDGTIGPENVFSEILRAIEV